MSAALHPLKALISASALMMALAGPVQAQFDPAAMAGADANGDGVLTCEEAREFRQTMLWAQDRNGDDQLDPQEFRAALPYSVGWFSARVAFTRIDISADGRITLEELAAAPLVRFDEADTDKDCRLTASEIEAAAPDYRGRL